jgi:phage tail sheath gpL-like
MIIFNEIPSGIRTPFTYVEFDSSRAVQGVPQFPMRLLVIGHATTQTAGTIGSPVRITRDDQVVDFGTGSQLARMIRTVRQNNAYTETWAVPVGDVAASAAAVTTLTFTGTATETALMALWIGGRRLQVLVRKDDVPSAYAAAVADAVNADIHLPVTAARTDHVVTLTAKGKGIHGSQTDVRFAYYPGEKLPGGVNAVVARPTAGLGVPHVEDLFAVIGGEQFDYIIQPWTEAGFMAALEDELLDRAGPLKMREGICFTALAGTHAQLCTWGEGRNCQFVSAMGAYGSPTPPDEWAAAYGAVAAYQLPIDPARPIHTLPLKGVLAPVATDRFTQQEQNLLLYKGVATWMVSADGEVQIQREVTTYQKNVWGQPDPSWLDVQTPATLAFLRKDIRFLIETRFPRHKLAEDGTRVLAGQPIVTPSILKDELIARATLWEGLGLIEGVERFKRELVVERNQGDRNRVDAVIPTDLINQFRVFAGQLQFII